MDRDEKKKNAESLHEELKKAKGIIFSKFQGITVAQDFELRRRIAGTGARYKVVKNTLIERAAKGTTVEPIAQKLVGTTSVALTEADPVALAKVLTEYAKGNPIFSFRSGVVEGRVVSLADFGALATLPSKEQLLSKVLFLFNSPAQRVASTLSGVARNLAYVIQQAVKENRFEARVEPTPLHRVESAPQEQAHSKGFGDLRAAADTFLNPPPGLAEEKFRELKQRLSEKSLDIRNPQIAVEVLDVGIRFSPAEGLGTAARGPLPLYKELSDSERGEFDAYWLANVDRLEKQFP